MTQSIAKILLPYGGGPEDVEKVVQFLRTRPTGASESDLVRTLGTKFADARRYDLYDVLSFFKRQGGVFRLTDRGQEYLRVDEEGRKKLLQDAIRNFHPYHSILDWAFHNSIQTLDADSLKHQWASKFDDAIDLTNKYRLDGAPVTLFSLLQMAGLGTFVIGRRGAKSRIEFDRTAMERYLEGASAENPPSNEEGDITAERQTGSFKAPPQSNPQTKETGHTFIIQVMGQVAKLIWPAPTMSPAEWEKLKKVGDAMFLD